MSIKTIVGTVIAVLLVVVLVIPVTSPTTSSGAAWVYDDYRECDSDVTVTGAFEKIEYDDKTYVHAKSVGSGTINGSTYHVAKAPLAVFLLWGQSNAMYLNADPTVVNEDCSPIKTRAYFYGITSDDQYRPVISWKDGNGNVFPDHGQLLSMTNPDGTFLIGNIEAPFASIYCDNSNNYRPYVINAAVGGWGIQNFIPGTVGNTNIHNIWNAAIDSIDTAHYTYKIAGWIMAVGESNAGTPEQTFVQYFDEVEEDLEDLGLDKGLIIQTNKNSSLKAYQAEEIIVKDNANVRWGSQASSTFTLDNGLLADSVHYSQKGDDIIGRQAAHNWLQWTEPYDLAIDEILSIIPLLLIAAILIGLMTTIIIRRSE